MENQGNPALFSIGGAKEWSVREVCLMGQAQKKVLWSGFLHAGPRQTVFSLEQKLWKEGPTPSPSCWQIIWEGALTRVWVFTKKKKSEAGIERNRICGSQSCRKVHVESDIESEIQRSKQHMHELSMLPLSSLFLTPHSCILTFIATALGQALTISLSGLRQ